MIVLEEGLYRTPHLLNWVEVWVLSWTLPPVHSVSLEESLDVLTGVLRVIILIEPMTSDSSL